MGGLRIQLGAAPPSPVSLAIQRQQLLVAGRDVALAGPLSGLDWNGNPTGRRAVVFTSPPAAYPMTYFWRKYARLQGAYPDRYFTTFFRCNNGDYIWGTGWETSYYGFHEYPFPAPTGDGKWEISTGANDFITRVDGSSPYVTVNRWYSQAAVVWKTNGGNTLNYKFYLDLPNVDDANVITATINFAENTPPSPCIIWGQSPARPSDGIDWGGIGSRWEEMNGILRGVKMFSTDLSEAHVVALGAKEYNSDVLSYVNANGLSGSRFYWNCNWRLGAGGLNDQSGLGNHPSLVTTLGDSPTQWNG